MTQIKHFSPGMMKEILARAQQLIHLMTKGENKYYSEVRCCG